MPIYVYEPTIWSQDEEINDCCYFEAIQSFKEAPLEVCPTCGRAVHRAVTSFSYAAKSVNSPEDANRNDPFQTWQNKKDSPAARAARLAMRHVCGQGCKH